MAWNQGFPSFLPPFLLSWDKSSLYSSRLPWTHYVAQSDLKLCFFCLSLHSVEITGRHCHAQPQGLLNQLNDPVVIAVCSVVNVWICLSNPLTCLYILNTENTEKYWALKNKFSERFLKNLPLVGVISAVYWSYCYFHMILVCLTSEFSMNLSFKPNCYIEWNQREWARTQKERILKGHLGKQDAAHSDLHL